MPYSAQQCGDHLSAQSYRTARYWGIKAVNEYPNSFYAHMCLGEADVRLGLYNSALYVLKKGIPLANSRNKLMLVYNLIGGAFNFIGNKKNSLMYDFKSLHLAKELGNVKYESAGMNNIAVIYRNEFKYKNALIYLKKALTLIGTKTGEAKILNNIALVYSNMNNYNKAIKYEKKSLKLNESAGNYYGTAEDYLNLGNSYMFMRRYFLAKKYTLTGISMEKKIGNKRWLGAGYGYLGIIYIKERNNKKALFFLTKAYKFFKLSGDSSDTQGVLFEINKIKSENNK